MRVIVAGALANKTGSGGEAWVRMSWLRGLALLGFETYFVEELAADMPHRDAAVCYFRDVASWFGVADRATLLVDGEAVVGPSRHVIERAATGAGLVNISGHLRSPRLLDRFATRTYVDIDPGFTQIWHADGHDLGLDAHDHHLTIGEHIGTARCSIPVGGIEWRPVRQPVILADWPVHPVAHPVRFTTVSTWRSPFGAASHAGRTYELKHHQFRRFAELPARLPVNEFEVALAIDAADAGDRQRLLAGSWTVTDPATVSAPADFRAFVARSGAEFSVAQGVYVDTSSGWFSDRTVRYLASGRPALVQDTGLAGLLPLGEGLRVFSNLDEAIDGATAIAADPGPAAEAARQIASEFFAHDRVLLPLAELLS